MLTDISSNTKLDFALMADNNSMELISSILHPSNYVANSLSHPSIICATQFTLSSS